MSEEEGNYASELNGRERTHLALARTYLANERTFLAWLRTGIALIVLGLGAAGLLTRDIVPGVPLVRSIAILLIVGGVFVVLAGARRYFRALRQISGREFRPATWSVAVTTILVIFIALMSVAIVLLLRR